MSTKPHEISPDDKVHLDKALEIASESGAPKAVIMWLTDTCVETGNSKRVDQHFITALAKQGKTVSPTEVRKIREHLRDLGVSVKLHVEPKVPPLSEVPPIPGKTMRDPFGDGF